MAFSALDKRPGKYRSRTSSDKLVEMQSFKLLVLLTAFLSVGLEAQKRGPVRETTPECRPRESRLLT